MRPVNRRSSPYRTPGRTFVGRDPAAGSLRNSMEIDLTLRAGPVILRSVAGVRGNVAMKLPRDKVPPLDRGKVPDMPAPLGLGGVGRRRVGWVWAGWVVLWVATGWRVQGEEHCCVCIDTVTLRSCDQFVLLCRSAMSARQEVQAGRARVCAAPPPMGHGRRTSGLP